MITIRSSHRGMSPPRPCCFPWAPAAPIAPARHRREERGEIRRRCADWARALRCCRRRPRAVFRSRRHASRDAQTTCAACERGIRFHQRLWRRPRQPARAARSQGSQGRRGARHGGFRQGARSRRCATWRKRSGLKFLRPTLAMARGRPVIFAGRSLAARQPCAPRKRRQRQRNPHRRAVRQLRLRAGRFRARGAIHARRARHRQQ